MRTHRSPADPARRAARLLGALGVLAVVAVGCGSSDTGAAPDRRDRTPTLPPVTPCPTAGADGEAFPPGGPSRLPHPPSATDVQVEPTDTAGIELLSFRTPTSLGESVQFVLDAYPAAGWAIGEGDAEGHEADVPFTRGAVHGKLRLREVGECATSWLVATVTGTDVDLDAVPGLEPGDDETDAG